MSDVTLNGAPVVEATIHVPRVGNWSAELLINADSPPSGAAALEMFGASWSGYVLRSGELAGRISVLLVGGAGGLWHQLEPRGYQGVPLGLVLRELLRDAGEQLAPSSTPAVLATALDHWPRLRGTADRCLSQLLEGRGDWRVLPSGAIWAGTETWPAAPDFEYQVIDAIPAEHRLELAAETAVLVPGVTLEGQRVSTVTHRLDATRWRTTALFEDPDEGQTEDKMRQALVSLIEDTMRSVDYLARYGGAVVAMRGTNVVDVRPDDLRFPELIGLPIRFLPGCELTLGAGDRVLVGFVDGNPTLPFCEPWGSGAMAQAKIVATEIVRILGVRVLVLGDNVVLGQEGGAEPGVKGTTLDSWLKGHSHKVTCGAAGTIVDSAPPTAPPPGSMLSTKVKVG